MSEAKAPILQPFGSLRPVRLGLPPETRSRSVRATAHDVVQETRLARVTSSSETPKAQLRELIEAHEFILGEARPLVREAAEHGDDGTNDIIVSEVMRTNELQAWFVGEHLVGND